MTSIGYLGRSNYMVIPSESNTKPSEEIKKSNKIRQKESKKYESVNEANQIKSSPPSIQERRATVAKRKNREGEENAG